MMYGQSYLAQASVALQKYLYLMLLHLDRNHPTWKLKIGRVRTMLRGMEEGWVARSTFVTAWKSPGSALDVVVLCEGVDDGHELSGDTGSERDCPASRTFG